MQHLAADSKDNPAFERDSLVAMTQGSIGYWLQSALQNELKALNIDKSVASVVTQVIVDQDDPAFKHPTKPIGPYYSKEEAQTEMASSDATFVEDAGRGLRKIVATPKPLAIKEIDVIDAFMSNNHIVVVAGGGSVPVVESGEALVGIEAVIDKDFVSQKLAQVLDADMFIVLTAVDNVYVNFNQPDQRKLKQVTYSESADYIEADQFAPGSMLPKVEATMVFVKAKQNLKQLLPR